MRMHSFRLVVPQVRQINENPIFSPQWGRRNELGSADRPVGVRASPRPASGGHRRRPTIRLPAGSREKPKRVTRVRGPQCGVREAEGKMGNAPSLVGAGASACAAAAMKMATTSAATATAPSGDLAGAIRFLSSFLFTRRRRKRRDGWKPPTTTNGRTHAPLLSPTLPASLSLKKLPRRVKKEKKNGEPTRDELPLA
jgi:hypothetical protein